MKLYKIMVEHAAPKDCWTNIECFLLAANDEAVYQWINKEKLYGCWEDRNEEDGSTEIYDDDCKVIGTETYKEKMLRLKGELFDEDRDFSDAYYGLTFYGWELIEDKDLDWVTLRTVGMLQTAD